MYPLRVVLLGKTGAGKSSSGNTIVGRGILKKTFSVKSVTETCRKLQSEISGKKVILIDTPGLIHTGEEPDTLEKEVKKCVKLSLPGPHAFLVVIRMDERFTEEDRNTVKWIQENFGEEVLKYTIVLLTHGDASKEPVEDFLQKNSTLSSVVKDFGGRYHMFNNKSKDRTQVRELKKKIEAMVEENGGGFYKVVRKWEAKMMSETAARAKAGRGLLQAIGEGIAESMKAAMQGAVLGATAAVGATVIASGVGAIAVVGATGAAVGTTVGAVSLGAGASETGVAEASGARVGGTATVAGSVAAVLVGAAAMVTAGAIAAGAGAAAGVVVGVAAAAVSGAGAIVGATAVAGAVGGAALVGGGPIGAGVGGTLGTVAGTAVGIIAGLTAAVINHEDLEKKKIRREKQNIR